MSARLEKHDEIALITMNDGKANAINPPMLAALHDAFDQTEVSGDVKAIVLTGLPGKFSAGFDLKYFQSQGAEATRDLVNDGGRLALRLYGLKKPLVAALTGHAIAMGCFITQGCDYRIATAGDFRIGANETAIGMVLPEFALQLLLARVRPDRLTEAAVIARLFGPNCRYANFRDKWYVVVCHDRLEGAAPCVIGDIAGIARDAMGYGATGYRERRSPA